MRCAGGWLGGHTGFAGPADSCLGNYNDALTFSGLAGGRGDSVPHTLNTALRTKPSSSRTPFRWDDACRSTSSTTTCYAEEWTRVQRRRTPTVGQACGMRTLYAP